MMISKPFSFVNGICVLFSGCLCSSSYPLHAQNVSHGISATLINVVQLDELNNTNSVEVTATVSINEFKIRDGSNRGDCNVQIGSGFSDDAGSGVLMTCVAQNGRNNNETNYPGINFCSTALDYSHSGGFSGAYYIPSFNTPAGAEFNVNVAAAYFPYGKWIGGLAQNSGDTNGGLNNLLVGSPSLSLGTQFVDHGDGTSTLNLTSLGINSQTDGVLLVTGGKNEDNYALSNVNTDGTWTLYVKDNGTDSDNWEQDPVAFVFIPKTNTTVISGRFRSDGAPLVFSGTTAAFNVVNTATGTWRLTIPGYSPSNGVLIISAEGGFSQNQDNIVSYEPDGDGWIIQSRDLPGNPPGLQTPDTGFQPVASFVFIPAGTTAALLSPLDNAQNSSASPQLQVNVSNTAPGNLTVKFFGRTAPTNSSDDFMIVALPDTQYYTAERFGGKKEMFFAQTEWIITNRVSKSIAYVAQLGDISDQGDIKSGAANSVEWKNATNAMYCLENPIRTLLQDGIPYGVAVGNHDSEPNGAANGTTLFYNQFFGIQHFANQSYYSGHYGNNSDNHFDFFSAGGMDFIVLYFEYDTNTAAPSLDWGDQVLATNQNRRAIIVTHNFGNTATPVKFSAQGAAIYNKLKHHTNVFMMLAGHVTGAGSRADTYDGNTIRTFVSDYQGWTNGGNGFMRLMTFSPKNNQIVVQTYSPWTDEYRTEAIHEFFFDYNMDSGGSVVPFDLIGSISGVAPGGVANFSWTGRKEKTAYDWYVVVTDPMGNTTTSPVWRFMTATNSAPTANSQFRSVFGDAATNLVLTATDPNGDLLIFQTNSAPEHGVNNNFNSGSGAITYFPAHGYRGFDQFTYHANDGTVSSPVVTVNLQVVSPPDANTNDIPDSWESLYGINDANADSDGDGQSNLEEFFANTNPTNAASVLHIDNASRGSNGHVTLIWPSVGGTRYRVQFSNGDTNGSFNGIFTDIERPVNFEMDSAPYGVSSTQTFVDDFTLSGAEGTNRARYYRVKTVQ
jgi:hypothetical protein